MLHLAVYGLDYCVIEGARRQLHYMAGSWEQLPALILPGPARVPHAFPCEDPSSPVHSPIFHGGIGTLTNRPMVCCLWPRVSYYLRRWGSFPLRQLYYTLGTKKTLHNPFQTHTAHMLHLIPYGSSNVLINNARACL